MTELASIKNGSTIISIICKISCIFYLHCIYKKFTENYIQIGTNRCVHYLLRSLSILTFFAENSIQSEKKNQFQINSVRVSGKTLISIFAIYGTPNKKFICLQTFKRDLDTCFASHPWLHYNYIPSLRNLIDWLLLSYPNYPQSS